MSNTSFPVHVQSVSEGLFTDTNRLNQPENTYRWALNSLLETLDGDLQSLGNEKGNEICANIPEGFKPIGHVLLDTNDSVLFLTDDTVSIIAIQDCNCNYKEVLRSSCLGFNSYYPIDSVFRLKQGCDRTLYFTDGLNSPYSIDIDSLQDYVLESVNDSFSNPSDKINYANNNDAWDCDKFKIFPNLTVPNLTLNRVRNTGGRLKVGAHQFAIRYLDQDLNPTNWFYLSQPIPIYDENLNTNYRNIDGGVSAITGQATVEDTALPLTSKSILLDISNLDLSFAYYQIAVIESTEGLGVVTDVYIQPRVNITSSSDTYTYTGVDVNNDIQSTINEIVIPRLVIDTAEYIAQVNNRLLLANTTEKAVDFSKFQAAASKIGSKYHITTGLKEEINNNAPVSPDTYFNYYSYMRDEVYSFAIVWVFNDGSVSRAFHIPGRPKNINPIDCTELPNSGAGTYETEVYNQCLYIRVYIPEPASGNPFPDGDIQVLYKIDGVPGNKFFDLPGVSGYTDIEVDCGNPNSIITDIQVNVSLSVGLNNTDVFVTWYKGLGDPVTINAGGNTIIPPATNGWDSSIITQNEDTLHLENIAPDQLERWQAYNTAFKLNDTSGIMAYYDSGPSNVYPSITDCDGNSIWGVDICGNSLEGTPIRHHKFPDAALEAIHTSTQIRYIGIEFFNITPPEGLEDQIQGYYIVRALRDDNNKTVLDKGYLDRAVYLSDFGIDRSSINVSTPQYEDAHITYLGLNPPEVYVDRDTNSVGGDNGNGNNDAIKDHREATLLDRIYAFHSPKVYFDREFFGENHIKIERQYEREAIQYFDHFHNIEILDHDWDLLFWNFKNEGAISSYINRTVVDTTYLDYKLGPSQDTGFPVSGFLEMRHPISENLETASVLNHLGTNHVYLISLEDSLDVENWFYASVKRTANVYSNLDGLKYYRTHSGMQTGTSVVVYGGDTHISRMAFNIGTYDDSRSYVNFYTESEINVELRHGGPELFEQYYKGPDVQQAGTVITRWTTFFSRFGEDPDYQDLYGSNNNENSYKWIYPDYWAYSRDFDKDNKENVYIPLDSSFDYCRKCIDEHPYRIHYSEQSFQEEQTDNYKAFLTNNYNDLLGDQGEITNLFIDRDRLFAHARKALWQIQTRPNEIVSNENTIFVGAGELLSIPPRKLVSTDYGYGGSVDRLSTTTTEFGTILVDSNMGKVFLLNEGLEEISQNGMRNWLENNMPIKFLKQFKKVTGIDYPCSRFTGSQAVGVQTIYDPRTRRIIIHKKDYEFLNIDNFKGVTDVLDLNVLGTKEGAIWFYRPNNQFIVVKGGINPTAVGITLETREYFKNNSWTLSYSLSKGKWVSYHSYMPDYMFRDHETFYSHIEGSNNSWKHNYGPYQSFYGTKYPATVEIIVNGDPTKNKIFNVLDYIHDVSVNNNADPNITFSSVYAYTDKQITADLLIKVKTKAYDGLSVVNTEAWASFINGSVRINDNLRDISLHNNLPSFTSDWDNIQGYYDIDGLGNGYIDRIPNNDARSTNISVYQKARLKGRWMGVRYNFQPQEDAKIVFQIHNTIYAEKTR